MHQPCAVAMHEWSQGKATPPRNSSGCGANGSLEPPFQPHSTVPRGAKILLSNGIFLRWKPEIPNRWERGDPITEKATVGTKPTSDASDNQGLAFFPHSFSDAQGTGVAHVSELGDKDEASGVEKRAGRLSFEPRQWSEKGQPRVRRFLGVERCTFHRGCTHVLKARSNKHARQIAPS